MYVSCFELIIAAIVVFVLLYRFYFHVFILNQRVKYAIYR